MADFVDIAINVDPNQMQVDALNQLTAALANYGVVGYIPQPGNFEVILLGVLAMMAADAAAVAAQVPSAIFRAFGTQLANIPYETGASATANSTWTLSDTDGHTIPAGTQVTVSSYGFSVTSDVVVLPTDDSATVNLTAVDIGSVYNGLSGGPILVNPIPWVASITLLAATSGGADPESDTDYQTRLVAELALQAPRPITASDYATFVLSVPSTIVPGGVVVGRSTSIDGFNPGSSTFTVSMNSTTTLTITSAPATGVYPCPGGTITGTNIPSNTTVVSATSSTIVISHAATATTTGILVSYGAYTGGSLPATLGGTFGNERCVTTFVTDTEGNALSNMAMADIAAWIQTYREVNFLAFVGPPSTATIYVTYTVHPLPGYDPTALIATVNAAITGYINPATWGGPQVTATQTVQWYNATQGFATLRYNKLLGVIENVNGVDYVPTGSAGLAIGFAATPTGTSDLALAGPAPLPYSDTTTPTVIGSTV